MAPASSGCSRRPAGREVREIRLWSINDRSSSLADRPSARQRAMNACLVENGIRISSDSLFFGGLGSAMEMAPISGQSLPGGSETDFGHPE